MKRIIIHHTAGSYKPNDTDKNAYHYLIDDVGNITEGYHKVSDNENCKDGNYAAHTYKGNTGSIGIAACCNYNFSLQNKYTKYPLTPKQFEVICKLSASMCIKYKISVDRVYTHYGFDLEHNIKQGKIDITYLPFKPKLNPIQVQEYFRAHIKYYITNRNKS